MKKLAGLILLGISISCAGQDILSKSVNLDVRLQRLDHVLEILSNEGNFFFSYNSKIVKKDSLVSVSVRNKSVHDVLNIIFPSGYEFRESGSYLIIRKAPIRTATVAKKVAVEEKFYWVTGYIYDEQSGSALNEASIYEKNRLVSVLTNEQGYFKLKFKGGTKRSITLFVGKANYSDTSIAIQSGFNQELTITLVPEDRPYEKVTVAPEDLLTPDSLRVGKNEIDPDITPLVSPQTNSSSVEKTGMGKLLLSAKQKVQSLNLKNFFTTRPFQLSVVPGLGTHGKMSGQVVNNFSFNVIGGYTAGTNGVEIGGLFNMNKKDARHLQIAGALNIVGGNVDGVQIAGVTNTVLRTAGGFQLAGVNNHVSGKFNGFQLGGVYNHVSDSLNGMQLSGVLNYVNRKTKGLQLAGVGNISNSEVNGVQVAGVFNYAKRLKGVQIGLINITDSSEGLSIGLINIAVHGYNKLSFSSNEVVNVNVAYKTGYSKLYSMLQAGVNLSNNNKVYSFGYGLGSEFNLNKRKTVSVNPELSAHYLYLGSWKYANILSRLNLNLHVRLGKYFTLFAGPSYSLFSTDQPSGIEGYRFPVPPSGYHTTNFNSKVSGWFGWNTGISIF
jgi:hypothetical protein